MKANYTHISVLLDRSGSMGSIKNDIMGGFNQFVKDQKAVDGDVTFTLAQFDNIYDEIYNKVNLRDIKDLTDKEYVPRGTTALNDSLARMITSTGNTLALMNEEDRPEKVMLVVITDGQENASREHTTASIKAMIEHQEKTYNWQVVYIGANQDSFAESKSRGMSMESTMNFSADTKGISSMYNALSSSTLSYRSAAPKKKFKFSS